MHSVNTSHLPWPSASPANLLKEVAERKSAHLPGLVARCLFVSYVQGLEAEALRGHEFRGVAAPGKLTELAMALVSAAFSLMEHHPIARVDV